LLIVPQELPGGGSGRQQLAQLFEHLGLPQDALARRKAFARQVPFLAENLPRHQVLGLLLDAMREPLKSGDGLLEESPEFRMVDLGQRVDADLDLLKRPSGVTLQELVKATGWQPHSVRGFMSGTIGNKMGTPVESFKGAEGDRSYRLSAK